jgi:hypothetical protein
LTSATFERIIILKEERIPKKELELFLETLDVSLKDIAGLHGNLVEFFGLPFEEWAGPGYAVAALFDPNVLTAKLKKSKIYLEFPEKIPAGIECLELRSSQKEKISFKINKSRSPQFYLPMLWGGVQWRRIKASPDWKPIATIAELPAVLVKDGTAIFAFNPLKVIHRYLNMADPSSTCDLTDLMVKAVLAASGIEKDLDDNELRRDFHAFGISTLLVCQLYRAAGKKWNVKEILPELRRAAKFYIDGEHAKAEKILSVLFSLLEKRRKEIVNIPIYIMTMPHGGIIIENEGYAEYDWLDAAAKVLNLLLDWTEKYGYRIAPDIGAGTLEEFVKVHPETVKRMKKLWDEGLIEFVNGTYSQPYMQLWPLWDQDKQFEIGLKTFTEIFGRRPTVYAAQEIAHHPALPDILVKNGFRHAIHRSQNLGLVPIDKSPIIDWESPSGNSIRGLPSHPLRSERRGGEIWRHLPILLLSERNNDIPFIAFTSLMDQTFIDIYNEEILRANRYAPVWGEFVTPSEFFEKTNEIQTVKTCYTLDQYHYELDLSGNSIHGHQTGGYSSEHAFMFKESSRLQALEKKGRLSDNKCNTGILPVKLKFNSPYDELKLLLTQEAHDCYIIPYFAPGYFMDGGLTDYCGPRYKCVNDGPRGLARAIRDAAKYPKVFSDEAPCRAVTNNIKIEPSFKITEGGLWSHSTARKTLVRTKAGQSNRGSENPRSVEEKMHRDYEETSRNGKIGSGLISTKEHSAEIDGENGRVIAIDGKKLSLGFLKFDGVPFEVEKMFSKDNKLCVSGKIPGFADMVLEYFFGADGLFCEISAGTPSFIWSDTKISWGSCVYIEHARDVGTEIIRNVSGVSQVTGIEKFHSLDFIEIRNRKAMVRLKHGGNIFFRQTTNTVQNRLWCYDEFCNRFWWGVEL